MEFMERMAEITARQMEVMTMIMDLKLGKDVNLDRMADLVSQGYRNEIALVSNPSISISEGV